MVASYNVIKPDDSLTVIKAKLKAQEAEKNQQQQTEQELANDDMSKRQGSSLAYKRFKYRLVSFDIMHPSITADMGLVEEPGVLKLFPDAVTSILLVRMEDTMLNPVFELKVTIPPIIKEFIMDNKNEVKFRIRFQSIYTYESEALSSVGEIANDILNDIFVTYTQDESDFGDMPLYKHTISMQELVNAASNLSAYNDTYSLFLWKEGHVEALRKIVNNVYSNTDILSVLIQCFNEYGIDSLLISPPDNKTQYSQIIIPPLNLMNLPSFIDENYGLYYRGTTFFYDFRCLYVLNKNGICDAYEEGEYKRTIITIANSGDSDTKRVGVAEDPESEEYFIFGHSNNLRIKNPSKINDIINGGNMYIIDSRNAKTVDLSNPNDSQGTYRVMEDKFGNSFNKGQYVSNILEENLKISIEFEDYDINIFTPNKEFVFNFTDSTKYKYSGTYRLYSEKIGFFKRGHDFFVSGMYNFTWKRGMDEAERTTLNEKVYGPNIEVTETESENKAATPPQPMAETDNSVNMNSDVTVPFDCNTDPAFQYVENTEPSPVTDYKTPSKAPVPLSEKAEKATTTESKSEK